MDIEDALSELLEDRDFVEISSRRGQFNLFEAVGGVRAELRHSNFLSFILSPAKTHGLGSKPLEKFLRFVLARMPADRRPLRALAVAVGDLDGAVVFREADNIDLLIEISELKLVVVIENKVGARAGDGQLARYKKVVMEKYGDWRKLFVFLTPDGIDPDEPEYVPLSYAELANLVERLLTEGARSYSEDVLLILRHYVEMVRRNIVEDEDLRNLAMKIYERHAEALNFIFESRPETGNLLSVIREPADKNTDLLQDRHTPLIFRFIPKNWLDVPALNSCPTDRWTKSGRNVLFEVKSFKTEANDFSDRILLSLILGPSEANLRQFIFTKVRANPAVFVGAGKAIGQSWVTIYSRELLGARAAENMEDGEKVDTITRNWDDFLKKDLPRLADELGKIALEASKADVSGGSP